MNSQGRVGKGVNPLQITSKGSVYFDIVRLNRLLIDGSKGVLTAPMVLILCCIASFGVDGCSTETIMKSLYGYTDAHTRRRLNNRLICLLSRGLVVRRYRTLFLSVHAEKLLSGKL